MPFTQKQVDAMKEASAAPNAQAEDHSDFRIQDLRAGDQPVVCILKIQFNMYDTIFGWQS